MRAFALIAAGLAAIAAPASAATYDHGNNAYNPNQVITPFGPDADGGSATYGQVLMMPLSGNLDSFSFTLMGSVGKVWAGFGTWTGGSNYSFSMPGEPVGSPTTLWVSDLVDSGAGTITFTPNVRVERDKLYVAYISVFGVDGQAAGGTTGLVLGDNSDWTLRYFTFGNGIDNPSGSSNWNNFELDVGDALFHYSVSNVPEPAEWALMIGGFAAVGAVARRRRKGLAFAA
jgi:hypothetical protein